MIGSRYCHFEIQRLLGTGGMGEVYLAMDTNLERRVALKFLPRTLTGDPSAQARLLDEARSCSRIQHANVAVIHSVEEDGGVFAICMEYVEGETLRQVLTARDLDQNETLTIATGIAKGVAAAHSHGIIHRDLKPANVMITPAGIVKVMDFGLALRPERSIQTTGAESFGTVAYMSPEQARGAKLTGSTDVFSFGSMLYEMITGRLPFYGENDLACLHAIISQEPSPVRDFHPNIPPGLERLVRACMAKSTADRPASMSDAAHILERLNGAAEAGPKNLINELTAGLNTEAKTRRFSQTITPLGAPMRSQTTNRPQEDQPGMMDTTAIHRTRSGRGNTSTRSGLRTSSRRAHVRRLTTTRTLAAGHIGASEDGSGDAAEILAQYDGKPVWKTIFGILLALAITAGIVFALMRFVIDAPPSEEDAADAKNSSQVARPQPTALQSKPTAKTSAPWAETAADDSPTDEPAAQSPSHEPAPGDAESSDAAPPSAGHGDPEGAPSAEPASGANDGTSDPPPDSSADGTDG